MPPRKTSLRVMTPGEKPKREKPKTILAAAEGGAERDLLESLRRRVAVALDDPNTPAKDIAALTRRMQELAKDLHALDQREREESGHGGAVPDEPFDASAI